MLLPSPVTKSIAAASLIDEFPRTPFGLFLPFFTDRNGIIYKLFGPGVPDYEKPVPGGLIVSFEDIFKKGYEYKVFAVEEKPVVMEQLEPEELPDIFGEQIEGEEVKELLKRVLEEAEQLLGEYAGYEQRVRFLKHYGNPEVFEVVKDGVWANSEEAAIKKLLNALIYKSLPLSTGFKKYIRGVKESLDLDYILIKESKDDKIPTKLTPIEFIQRLEFVPGETHEYEQLLVGPIVSGFISGDEEIEFPFDVKFKVSGVLDSAGIFTPIDFRYFGIAPARKDEIKVKAIPFAGKLIEIVYEKRYGLAEKASFYSAKFVDKLIAIEKKKVITPGEAKVRLQEAVKKEPKDFLEIIYLTSAMFQRLTPFDSLPWLSFVPFERRKLFKKYRDFGVVILPFGVYESALLHALLTSIGFTSEITDEYPPYNKIEAFVKKEEDTIKDGLSGLKMLTERVGIFISGKDKVYPVVKKSETSLYPSVSEEELKIIAEFLTKASVPYKLGIFVAVGDDSFQATFAHAVKGMETEAKEILELHDGLVLVEVDNKKLVLIE